MSTESSLREALVPRGDAEAPVHPRSSSRNNLLLRTAGDIGRPVDVVRLLRTSGLSLRAAHQVLERIARGEHVPVAVEQGAAGPLIPALRELGVEARVIRSPAVDVQKVRTGLGLSQSDFARRFGFTLDTVQNWEQGRNLPEGPAQTLLKIIERHPEVVDEALAADQG